MPPVPPAGGGHGEGPEQEWHLVPEAKKRPAAAPPPAAAEPAGGASGEPGSQLVSTRPFPGSRVVMVHYAPAALYRKATLHVSPEATYDDIKWAMRGYIGSAPSRFRLAAFLSGSPMPYHAVVGPPPVAAAGRPPSGAASSSGATPAPAEEPVLLLTASPS